MWTDKMIISSIANKIILAELILSAKHPLSLQLKYSLKQYLVEHGVLENENQIRAHGN